MFYLLIPNKILSCCYNNSVSSIRDANKDYTVVEWGLAAYVLFVVQIHTKQWKSQFAPCSLAMFVLTHLNSSICFLTSGILCILEWHVFVESHVCVFHCLHWCILCVCLLLFFIVYVVMGCMNFTELQTRELD